MLDLPAEWDQQLAIWTAWPSHPNLWRGNLLSEARNEIAAMVRYIARTQRVNVLAYGDDAVTTAKQSLPRNAEVIPARFGDLWFRDTGPIFAFEGKKSIALRFRTNGWGGKFIYPYDDEVGDTIANEAQAEIRRHDYVLEGGSIEHDGVGTLLTTRQCILNPNRNPGWTQADAEMHLLETFNAKRVVWLDEGLLNDHTDGHIDNIARFIGKNHVVCQKSFGTDDPNAAVYAAISSRLRSEGIRVSEVTSPGLVKDQSGEIVPASHMNFIIANDVVVVPTYGSASTETAIKELQQLFGNRQVVGSSSSAVLTGGGSFHCITQQQPAKRT